MSQVVRERLRSFSLTRETPTNAKPAITAAHRTKQPADLMCQSLIWLVENVADRYKPNKPPFDTKQTAAALRACITGRELKLCNLNAEMKSFLRAMRPEDWTQLQAAPTLLGGMGFGQFEIEADLLDCVLPWLQSLPNIECVSLWAPPDGGSIDFGLLKPLRINILGTPAMPMEITVLDGVHVEGKESHNRAIQNSVVRKRDASGQVGNESTPLPLAHVPVTRVHPLQDAPSDDLAIGVKALMRCGIFDASGKFGIDITKLSPEHVKLVQVLGDRVWTTLAADARNAGLKVSWVSLHKDLRLDLALVSSLKRLFPLITISVPTLETPAAVLALDNPSAPQPRVDLPRVKEEAGGSISRELKPLLRCVTFDARGRLGIDLTSLTEVEVRNVQARGAALWPELQARLQDARLEKITWLRLHDDFILSNSFTAGLNALKSLEAVSVATPRNGMLLNLNPFQGNQVRDVEVRCRSARKWVVMVPPEVKVRSSSPVNEAVNELRVLYLQSTVTDQA